MNPSTKQTESCYIRSAKEENECGGEKGGHKGPTRILKKNMSTYM